MDLMEIKLECLRLAQQNSEPSAKDIVNTAEWFSNFVLDTATEAKVTKAIRDLLHHVSEA